MNISRHCLGVAPTLPMGSHHGANLPVEEAVRKGDEEPLEGDEDVPREDVDRLQRGLGLGRTHDGHEIGDAQKRDNDYEGFQRAQIDVLSLQMVIARSEFGDNNLRGRRC